MNNLVLSLDTSNENLGLSLWSPENGTIGRFNEVLYRKQSDSLHVEIENLLKKAGKTLNDVTLIAVTKGPGSFTGVRVALAAAKGFAYALNIPAIGVTTLEAVAASVAAKLAESNQSIKGDHIVVWIEAHGGDIYQQIFDLDGLKREEEKVLKVEEAANNLMEGAIVCGNALLKHTQHLPSVVTILDDQKFADPVELAKMAWSNHTSSNGDTALTPLYLRPLTYKKTNEQSTK